jgi:hypothetical protein
MSELESGQTAHQVDETAEDALAIGTRGHSGHAEYLLDIQNVPRCYPILPSRMFPCYLLPGKHALS